MLGMRRRKLLFMMFLEEIWNSIFSLLIGIPLAIFISEVISLVTAKIIGLGIIGHKFSFSFTAIIGTILGYFIIRLAALVILCMRFSKKQIDMLLNETHEKKHKKANGILVIIKLILGIILLVIAYSNAIKGNAWENNIFMGATIIIGLCGMFLFFHGIGILFQIILTQYKNMNGLRIFTFRQIQESVFHKPNILAIASILIMMALCFFAYGVAVGSTASSSERHIIDYTFKGNGRKI
jgi:putative ABC transport system permease protein